MTEGALTELTERIEQCMKGSAAPRIRLAIGPEQQLSDSPATRWSRVPSPTTPSSTERSTAIARWLPRHTEAGELEVSICEWSRARERKRMALRMSYSLPEVRRE